MMKNIKKELDEKFYNSLDKRIKNILSFDEFVRLEKINEFSCNFYLNLINEIARITKCKGSLLEKILNFIKVLDLEPEKIGFAIKNCNFVKKLK